MPAGNPSGYAPATPSGRDPTTGAILRDRFHQMRGDEYQMTEGTPLADKLASDFLADRGAPVTPQNMAVARQYLQGGALGAMEQQQATESDIADAAIAAETGGGPAGGATPPSPLPASPVTPTPAAGTPSQAPAAQDPGGIPGIGPEWMLTPMLAAIGKRITNAEQPGPRMPVTDAAPAQIEGPPARPQIAPPPKQITDQRPQAPVAAAEQPNPYARQVEEANAARAAEAPAASPDTAPIETEEVVPKEKASEGRKAGTTSFVNKDGKTVEVTVYREPGGKYHATADGKRVDGKSIDAVKRALRAIK